MAGERPGGGQDLYSKVSAAAASSRVEFPAEEVAALAQERDLGDAELGAALAAFEYLSS